MNRRILFPLVLVLASLHFGCSGSSEQQRLDEQSDFHLQLAYGHWGGGEVPQAIEELRVALAIDPQNAEAHYMLAFIFSGRQMHNESIQHYRQALLIRPEWHEVRNNLGVVFLQLERWEDAIAIFEELTQVPEYATPGHAYNNLGWAQLNLGLTREALSSFEMATYLQPTLCLAYNNQGIALERLERLREAIEAYSIAVRRCEGYAEPRYRLARLHQRDGEYTEARALFEECIQLVPEANLGRRCREYLEQL